MELVLGIDLGSSYLKAGLFDRSGSLRGLGRVAMQPADPASGACEMAPEDFWQRLGEAVAAALGQAGSKPADIACVSYATQANSFLLLDRAGRPLTPLVLWQDRRAISDMAVADALARLDGFPATSGLGVPMTAEFAVAKLAWLRRNCPQAWTAMRRVMTISDYLVFGLTGEPAGDCGSASLLGLLDAARGDWWPGALAVCGLRREQMARLVRPGSPVGRTQGAQARRLGIRAGTSLVAGSLDHHVAALGAGAGVLADCSVSIGTVLACAAPTARYEPRPGVCLAPGAGAGYYAMTFDPNGAAALEDYRDTFAPEYALDELLAFAAGERKEHGHGHRVRAILQSVSDSAARCLAGLPAEWLSGRVCATGGGARSDLWLQIMADRTGRAIARPDCPEPGCRGAAMLASAGAGWFASAQDACVAWARLEKVFEPATDPCRCHDHA